MARLVETHAAPAPSPGPLHTGGMICGVVRSTADELVVHNSLAAGRDSRDRIHRINRQIRTEEAFLLRGVSRHMLGHSGSAAGTTTGKGRQ